VKNADMAALTNPRHPHPTSAVHPTACHFPYPIPKPAQENALASAALLPSSPSRGGQRNHLVSARAAV